jgi:hydrocephalus-inducing protein
MSSETRDHKKSTKKDTGFKKYSKSSAQDWIDPSAKLKPSDLSKSALDIIVDDYPMILEFNNIKDNTFQIHSNVDIDQPLFQPSPKVVIFEDYAPFAVHEKKLYFRNNDISARRMKIIQPDSPFFEISSAKLSNGEPLRQSKLASGMEIYYTIKFKPQEVRDYSLDLICATEREKFVVPIRAIGMRPRLTFPDEVHFGNCPIKTATRKAILVQNIGASSAEFTMKSLNSNFSCSDEVNNVEPGGSQMVELFFSPTTGNLVTGDLEIVINKGVKCYVSLTGAGSNVDVSLSTPSVNLEPSYISLISTKSLRIKNLSNNPIKYTWKSFSCEEEEESERNRLLMEINRMEDIELSLLRQRVNDGLFIDENHDSDDDDDDDIKGQVMIPFSARAEEAALVRKYRNLRVALKNDPMQFVDDIFEITPVDGQVWANSEMEIKVSFRPDTAAMFNCLAFLDISGRCDRLPLHLSGMGIGPQASLSFDVLDVGDVFVNNELNYELTLLNKGDIPAQKLQLDSRAMFWENSRSISDSLCKVMKSCWSAR